MSTAGVNSIFRQQVTLHHSSIGVPRAQVRRQFIERPGIMEYKEKPDYARCVSIVAASALRVSGGLNFAPAPNIVICSSYYVCSFKVLQTCQAISCLSLVDWA